MGATIRNASEYMEKLKMNEDKEKFAKSIMHKMSIEQLSDLVSFCHKMGQICSEALQMKLTSFMDEPTTVI
ncbi:OLC1v1032223C1 [Oldenlandia corymbosa var. corymbosa]|uniref:OLC1v1032223C1 n=1 Tax=Oldenlandia corymbosa var. corymbosa TaxID=529605 RepID=A0AAV1CL45_OLDCO|nr:OLC1v1032223C1 [Oldenlandia corymbosa var. corymbosa]